MARDGLEPRIGGLQTRALLLGSRGAVIVVRIPRSLHAPHRVIYKGSNRFWMRSSAGKFEPNAEELRQLFTAGAQRRERILAFHQDRVRTILAGKAPVRISNEHSLLILHIVPFNALDATSAVASLVAPGYKQPGGIVGLYDNTAAGSLISEMDLLDLQNWGNGLEADLVYGARHGTAEIQEPLTFRPFRHSWRQVATLRSISRMPEPVAIVSTSPTSPRISKCMVHRSRPRAMSTKAPSARGRQGRA